LDPVKVRSIAAEAGCPVQEHGAIAAIAERNAVQHHVIADRNRVEHAAWQIAPPAGGAAVPVKIAHRNVSRDPALLCHAGKSIVA
jgi:hypothetical protein